MYLFVFHSEQLLSSWVRSESEPYEFTDELVTSDFAMFWSASWAQARLVFLGVDDKLRGEVLSFSLRI
jgi:hypothetical protein